uniref:NADH-ubiquinone oxidoreductase chain 2 n=1 Tax=Toxicochlespira sp. MNHN IM 2013-9841 TaxID=2259818 RepID=A0A344H1T9_9COND|nr:NADH dehydrogenase subunit 2 [Toxicochlespira sp. MNHN IM 2013-9841]
MFSSLPFNYMFLLMMGIGTIFSVSSVHWLGIWAGLEINMIGFVPILIYQKSVSETESAVKYFIMQALGSGLLVFSSLITFSTSFTWDLYSSLGFKNMSMMILVISLLVKMGMFPFHYWLPSVMAGLPWFSCLLLATWQKLAPLFLLLCLTELNILYSLVILLALIGVGSSLIGGIGGVNQTQIRALLAYSSIAHLGWMMFALLHGEWGLKSYLGLYITVSICLFMTLWYSDSKLMKNIGGSKISNSYQMVVMLFFLSLAGLPPLLGFIPKWSVIMMGTNSTWISLILLLILGSLLSLFYYLSLFFSLFLSSFKKYEMVLLVDNKLISLMITLNILGGIFIMIMNLLNNM